MNLPIQQRPSALEIIRLPHFSPYKMYVRRDVKLVVCMNPKVGSTSFRKVLVEGLKMIEAKPMLSKLYPVSERRRYMTAPIRDYLHALRHQQDYEFHCFTRNPYKRLLSAWNDKLVRDFKIGKYSKRFVKLIPKIRKFALERDLPGSDTSTYVPFATLIAYIESEAEGKRNQHWDTQHSVLQMSKITFTHIHRMENGFAENVAKIMNKVGIPENWTFEKMQRPANASGKAPESVYNQELADRVYAIYQEDFERFGYDRESWKDC